MVKQSQVLKERHKSPPSECVVPRTRTSQPIKTEAHRSPLGGGFRTHLSQARSVTQQHRGWDSLRNAFLGFSSHPLYHTHKHPLIGVCGGIKDIRW